MEQMFFTEENSIEVVTRQNEGAVDARLKEVMEVITRKLHEAVKEIEPTQDEWFKAIMFLTDTGHMCNEWRQEYILLCFDAGRRNKFAATARRVAKHGSWAVSHRWCARIRDGHQHLPRPEGRGYGCSGAYSRYRRKPDRRCPD